MPIEAHFLQGESAILRAEPDHGWRFAGWVGDVPEGREQDETLVVTMDRDRWIWATFEEGPAWEPVPWDTETDSDGDGVLDLIEHLLADRNPFAAEAGRNPLEVKRGAEGVSLELAVWELYPWLWALEYSEDLRSWAPVPEELVTRNYETREGRELIRIFVRMPATETAFFRLRISEESR